MNDDMLSPQSLSIEPPRRDRITAIASAVQRRPVVLVLGMHRSGTSLCSHILSALGIDMSDDIDVNPSNGRGHWERREIVEFHDRILRLFNRDFSGRFHDFVLPVAWWADPRVAQIKREIVAFLKQRMGDGYFGFKDPRTVRLMPMWHQILNELKLAPKIVLCLRNPAQVARSLQVRDGLDLANGEYRWLVHMIDFYRYASNLDCCTVEYEEWFNNPPGSVKKLQQFLGLQWQQSESDLGLVLSGIIDPAARHDGANHRDASQPLVRTLYKLAAQSEQDAAARDQITYIASQFVSFQQLQKPLQQAFEEVALTAAKYFEVEREATALRAVVTERNADLAAADARTGDLEGGLAAAKAEVEKQRAQIADLARERDEASGLKAVLAEREATLADLSRQVDELVSALEVGRAEAVAREAALTQAERVGQAQVNATEVIQAEVAALREALVQAERVGQERAAAAAASQTEMRGLREMLAKAEGEAKERAAAVAASQAEMRTLRETLAKAEDEARERTRTTAALHAEIATLQETLSAARQVGKAVIAAFRIQTATPMTLDSPHGWWQTVIRFFGARARA